MGTVIAVASGKGGTGKTSFCANIAVSLCALGEKVLLIDADSGMRSLDLVLGMTDRLLFSYGDVIRGNAGLKEAAVAHPVAKNLRVLTAPGEPGIGEVYAPEAIAALLQARCERLTEIPEKVDFFQALPEYDIDLFTNKKSKTNPDVCRDMLEKAIPMLENLPQWDNESIHNGLIDLATSLEVKNATLMWPVRIAAAGKAAHLAGAIAANTTLPVIGIPIKSGDLGGLDALLSTDPEMEKAVRGIIRFLCRKPR